MTDLSNLHKLAVAGWHHPNPLVAELADGLHEALSEVERAQDREAIKDSSIRALFFRIYEGSAAFTDEQIQTITDVLNADADG